MHKYFRKIAQDIKAASITVLDSKPARHAVPRDPLRLLLLDLHIMWEALGNATMVIDIKLLDGVTFYFIFFFNFGLDTKWALNGYMEMKGQATSFLHFYSSGKTFCRKGHKKVVRLGWEESKVMPLQGWSMVHLLGIKYSTGNIFSCEESTSSAAVWKVQFIPENAKPGFGQRSLSAFLYHRKAKSIYFNYILTSRRRSVSE